MTRTSGCEDISTRRHKIAELTREAPTMTWTTLAHHIDVAWLEEAYRRTRKDGAVGVDGVTTQVYEERLQENLRDLLERFKSGRYRAAPVRRVHIPKDGTRKTRPIGIPTLEEKSSSGRCWWCSNCSTSRSFWTALTAFARDEVPTRRLRRCGGG